VKSAGPIKTAWTWEEWQQSRAARRAATDRITPASVRRKRSSSDARLRKTYNGRRGPKVR